jgi:hypothetical protein
VGRPRTELDLETATLEEVLWDMDRTPTKKGFLRWTPKFGPVAESSEFRVGAGLEQQPRHPNTQ